MKTSQYNTIIPLENDFAIIFNALTQKYLATSKKAIEETAGNLSKVTNLMLLNNLQEIGAIIADEINEEEQLYDLIRSIDDDDSCFHLHINPTLDCNFRCHYCYENHLNGSHLTDETLKAIYNLMECKISGMNNLKFFSLSFFGGEPLMCFHNAVKPIIEKLHLLCANKDITPSVHFTSNGFLINDAMIEFFKKYPASFQITLDGHREFHNKVRYSRNLSGSYDKIFSNIIRLAEIGCDVLVRINYTAENILSIPSIIEDFKAIDSDLKKYIRFDLQRVWQDISPDRLDEISQTISAYAAQIRHTGFHATTHYIKDTVHNSCYGDKRHYALINFDGYVFRCTARDFNESNRAGKLLPSGEIQWFNNALESRLAAKFVKPVCRKCRIAPICGGGCCQAAIERTNPNKCMYGYTEAAMDKIVIDRFEYLHLTNNE